MLVSQTACAATTFSFFVLRFLNQKNASQTSSIIRLGTSDRTGFACLRH